MNDLPLNNTYDFTKKDSIFRIGKVFSVSGLEIKIKVDKEKNSSHLIYKGELLKNISVGGYLKISKGFTSIIVKVNGESIKEEKYYNEVYKKEENKINRILEVQLLGYIENGEFKKGIKELPLIDNLCFLLDNYEFTLVHKFIKNDKDEPINIGTLAYDNGQNIEVGVNNLFASHIGIFGNTGSGKSYTLAQLYRQLFLKFGDLKKFKNNAKFLLIDFNGEYNKVSAIIDSKEIYNLNTRKKEGEDKIPLSEGDILDVELISIMASATEKTQKPFIERSTRLYKYVLESDTDNDIHFKRLLKKWFLRAIQITDKAKGDLLIDYFINIVPEEYEDGITINLRRDIRWHGNNQGFYNSYTNSHAFNQLTTNETHIVELTLYKQLEKTTISNNIISALIQFMYLQLIMDIMENRAQNDHIAPTIGKLRIFQRDFDKVINTNTNNASGKQIGKLFSSSNFVVLNLDKANIQIKKMLPLLVCHKIYGEHKNQNKKGDKSLHIIIDEAHNILSYSSERESETWKDYRLETFEEIIKEGRKFGVFLTIASQRPSDLSSTIISQLHNYFIHRLVNERDIEAMGRSISSLDKVSHAALPILPIGACVFTGLAAQIPVIIQISLIPKENEPDNKTIDLINKWKD
jgi:hypothetical protein